MSAFTCFVVIAIKRQCCFECILKFEGFAQTKGSMLCNDLQQDNKRNSRFSCDNSNRPRSELSLFAFFTIKNNHFIPARSARYAYRKILIVLL